MYFILGLAWTKIKGLADSAYRWKVLCMKLCCACNVQSCNVCYRKVDMAIVSTRSCAPSYVSHATPWKEKKKEIICTFWLWQKVLELCG